MKTPPAGSRRPSSRQSSGSSGRQSGAGRKGESQLAQVAKGREVEFWGIGLVSLGLLLILSMYAHMAGPLGTGIDKMFGWLFGQRRGQEGEARALRHLQRQGLKLVERNYRIGGGPRRPAGEIDLIMRDRDGTLVFVEVRSRGSGQHGGAAASVDRTKQRRIVRAAQVYLQRYATPPACRFDVVAIEGDELHWLQGAFDSG